MVSLSKRGLIAAFAVLALIAAHGALFSVFSGAGLSLFLVAGLAGLVVLKYVWWRLRR
jgi:uncharacterized membrane protein